MNRRMRSRMYGGVGGGAGIRLPIPMRLLLGRQLPV